MGAGCQTQSQVVEMQKNAIPKANITTNKAVVVEKDGQVPPQALKQKSEESSKKIKVKVFESQLIECNDYMEPWLCSGAQEDDGCQNETAQFQPGMGTNCWVSDDGGFRICDKCAQHYKDERP